MTLFTEPDFYINLDPIAPKRIQPATGMENRISIKKAGLPPVDGLLLVVVIDPNEITEPLVALEGMVWAYGHMPVKEGDRLTITIHEASLLLESYKPPIPINITIGGTVKLNHR